MFPFFSKKKKKGKKKNRSRVLAIIIITRLAVALLWYDYYDWSNLHWAGAVRHKSPGPLKGGFLFIPLAQQKQQRVGAVAAAATAAVLFLSCFFIFFFLLFSLSPFFFHRRKRTSWNHHFLVVFIHFSDGIIKTKRNFSSGWWISNTRWHWATVSQHKLI